jgi:alpha-N-arabinofuranosidase
MVSDKVAEAGFTGLINQEGGIFRAEGDEFVATPIYYVFEMYADHQGGQSLRTVIEAPQIASTHEGRPISISGLSGSASIKGQELTLTVVNSHFSEAQEASISLRGGKAARVTVTTLAHSDSHAQNTFEMPYTIQPMTQNLEVSGSEFLYTFPPRSVSRLTMSLRGGAENPNRKSPWGLGS